MAQHEISSTQVRALLLLLVLGPLVAAVLLVSFLAEFADAQREDAIQQLRMVYQQSLLMANSSFERQLRAGTAAGAGMPLLGRAFDYFQEFFSGSVIVRVTDEASDRVLETARIPGENVGSTRLGFEGASVRIDVLIDPKSPELAGLRAETQLYVWVAVLAVGINLVIAGLAAWIVSRQLRIHELRGSTLATVAHELRTPLASMRLLLETLVARRVKDEKQSEEYLHLAFRENERLSRLVERFLTFSRVESGTLNLKKTKVSPAQIVQRAIEAAGLRVDAPILQVQMQNDLPEIEADADAVVMALMNLIENAIKYSGEEKKITLRAGKLDHSIEFSVSDNGIGIPKSELRAIFRDFHQVDRRLSRSAEGCGLGLSIVKSLVQAHGGRVQVESVMGEGSTFTIHLPIG